MKTLFALACVAVTSASFAATWTEVGDAGYLPGSAQMTGVGGTPLTSITGTRAGASEGERVDMYLIRITQEAAFNASTSVDFGGSTAFDSRLYLFSATGAGVAFNDDDPFASGGASTLTSLNVTTNGLYYLAIDAYSSSATGATAGGSAMFNYGSPFTNQELPLTGAAPVDGWSGNSTAGGAYTIALSGCQAVPEPASLAAVGLGVAALLRRRRK